jgi:hypothetical protein
MWKNEIMVHEQLLSYLNMTETKRGEVEMYFDIVALIKQLAVQSKQRVGTDQSRQSRPSEDDEENDVLQELLPSTARIAEFAQDRLDLKVK